MQTPSVCRRFVINVLRWKLASELSTRSSEINGKSDEGVDVFVVFLLPAFPFYTDALVVSRRKET